MFLQMDFIKQEPENIEVPIILVSSFFSNYVLYFQYDAGLLKVPYYGKGFKMNVHSISH